MAQVRYKGSTGEGGILEVADTTPYLSSGKYELYTPPLASTTQNPSAPAVPPLGAPSVDPIAALNIPQTNQPLFATNMFDESPEAKAARYAELEKQRQKQIGEVTGLAETSKGGVEAQFQTGSRTGTGYDSVKDIQIKEVNKQLAKSIDDINAQIADAKLKGDTAAEETALKKLALALQIKDQADTMALNQAKLKLDALQFGETQKQNERSYGLDLKKLGLDESQFNSTMALNLSKFEEDKRQFGESQAMEKWKTEISQSDNEADRQLKFQTLLNDTPAGQKVSLTLSNGQKLEGIGRKKATGSGTSETDKETKAFYDAIAKGQEDLKAGSTWGEVYNRIAGQFGTPSDILDAMLNKDQWGHAGAFQEFKQSTQTKNVVSTSYNNDGSKTIIYSDGSSETIK